MKAKLTWSMKVYFMIAVFLSIIVTLFAFQLLQLIMIKLELSSLEQIPPNLQIIVYCACSGGLIALIFNRSIISPLQKISAAAQKVAEGDFTVRADVNTHLNELEHLAKNFNVMVVELGATETFRNDFISNVSHEFKTPLNAIEGYIHLFQDNTISEEERAEYKDIIIFNTRRLSVLVENILMLAKMDNQHIPLTQNHFKLDEQIRYAIVLLEDKWGKKDIELDVEMEDILFWGPELLISHLWINLIDNAIKYTHNNGKILIRLSSRNRDVEFSIEDNGIGMSKEVTQRIFDKFYQGDTSHQGEGNGVGLALVKQVIDLCSGEIVVESHLGKGSKFTVTLPTISKGRARSIMMK